MLVPSADQAGSMFEDPGVLLVRFTIPELSGFIV
jgi:hypothetical protein